MPDGEINVPIKEGSHHGRRRGRRDRRRHLRPAGRAGRDDAQITLFDSTGIAIQDSATVPLEYQRAVEAGVGVEKKMIST